MTQSEIDKMLMTIRSVIDLCVIANRVDSLQERLNDLNKEIADLKRSKDSDNMMRQMCPECILPKIHHKDLTEMEKFDKQVQETKKKRRK